MDLSQILSILGKSGLYKLVAQTKNGVIIESLADKKRTVAFDSDTISSLEEISVFTVEKDIPLKDVFKMIHDKEGGKSTIDPKVEEPKIRDYFSQILPNYDKEKVYLSDIRKMLTWYNLLLANNMLDFSEPKEGEVKAEHADIPDEGKNKPQFGSKQKHMPMDKGKPISKAKAGASIKIAKEK